MLKHYGFKTVAKGYRHLDFPDGTHIELHYPSYFIKNVVYTNRPRAEVRQWVMAVSKRLGRLRVFEDEALTPSPFPIT